MNDDLINRLLSGVIGQDFMGRMLLKGSEPADLTNTVEKVVAFARDHLMEGKVSPLALAATLAGVSAAIHRELCNCPNCMKAFEMQGSSVCGASNFDPILDTLWNQLEAEGRAPSDPSDNPSEGAPECRPAGEGTPEPEQAPSASPFGTEASEEAKLKAAGLVPDNALVLHDLAAIARSEEDARLRSMIVEHYEQFIPEFREALLEERIAMAKFIGERLAANPGRPNVLVMASTMLGVVMAFYRDLGHGCQECDKAFNLFSRDSMLQTVFAPREGQGEVTIDVAGTTGTVH